MHLLIEEDLLQLLRDKTRLDFNAKETKKEEEEEEEKVFITIIGIVIMFVL